MSVFRLTMFPASEGDCLILSYGNTKAKLRHIIVDGGRKATWLHLKQGLEVIAARGEEVDLLLLSHIDADHIDGLVEMASADVLPVTPKAFWFNGFEQLKTLERPGKVSGMGIKSADAYSKAIARKEWPLNEIAGGGPIYTQAMPAAFDFADLTLQLISPDLDDLTKLYTDWRKALAAPPRPVAQPTGRLTPMGKRPMPPELDPESLSGPSNHDTTLPNGSSIALIAAYAGRTVLLGADAHPDTVLGNLKRLSPGGDPLKIDLVKLPHHGSRANITREILEKLECNRFAVSTSGAVFGHPDPEAISRILKFGHHGHKTLYFNYSSERTLPWNDPELKAIYGYDCVYSSAKDAPLVIDI